MRNKAFTLAEVLITLTIIGVIAALTIPNLMKNYECHILETSFKKAISTINHSLSLMVYEEGTGLKSAYATYNQETATYSGDESVFLERFSNYIKKRNFSANLDYNYKNFNKSTNADYRFYRQNTIQTENGMFVRPQITSGELLLYIDTNGKKGPNRLGYDYFLFMINNKDQLDSIYNSYHMSSGAICDITDTSKNNGLGCAKYALVNKCPWDGTKTYWECLK